MERELLDGERVVFRSRVHWRLFMGPVLLTVFVFLPMTWLLAGGSWRGYAWVPLAIGLVFLLVAFIKRQSSAFAVTNKRVMMKVGVFRARSIELLLRKVEAISVDQSVLGRVFGYGNIVVTGSGGTKEAFSNIQSPLAFRRAVQSATDT
jgi:uncharacterized membrane protein YdbT with pleckstrin-like domain